MAWKDRNNILYNNEVPCDPAIAANTAWFEFEATIRATTNLRRKTLAWWNGRSELHIVDPALAEEKGERLQADIARLARYLPYTCDFDPEETPLPQETDDFIPIPEDLFLAAPAPDSKWRLAATPRPGSRCSSDRGSP